MTETPSPLSEVKPNSLAELFARDPNGWDQRDLDTIVAALRADRARHAQAEAEGKVRGAKKSGPAPTSLDELGL